MGLLGGVWSGFRALPVWIQAAGWLFLWPLLTALFLSRWQRLPGMGGKVAAVAVLLVGSPWFLVVAAFDAEPSDTAPDAVEADQSDASGALEAATASERDGASEASPEASAAVTADASPAAEREPRAPGGELSVHFLDVGQGDATLLVGPETTMLIDTGRHDTSDVVPALKHLGVDDIDVVAVTHGHADHIGQLDEVLDAVDVDEVWMSGTPHTTQTFDQALRALERSDAAYEQPRSGDVTRVGAMRVEVLNPQLLVGDLDDDSLALRVVFGDLSLLFTGDAESDIESQLVSRHGDGLASTIYQVGHHGSTTSTSAPFLSAVAPELAIYSAGEGNQYGHPAPGVINRLERAGAEVYGTDVHGTVTLTTDGTDWDVDTDTTGEITRAAPEPRETRRREPGGGQEAKDVTVTAVDSPVDAGEHGTVTVDTTPGASCTITVTYSSGPSSAQGLEPRSADGGGTVRWTWLVGSRTTPGEWPIEVSCGSATARTSFVVQ